MRRLKGTAEARFEALVAEHEALIRKVARMYVKTLEDQEDLAGEIRLQLWRAFPKYDAGRLFSTWMYRIALNVAISAFRKEGHDRPKRVSIDEAAEVAARESAPDEFRILHDLLETLEPMDRALLLLTLEELSHAEIGDVLGISPQNVATKLSRLRARLRRVAAPE